jgi:dihydroorotase
MSDILRLPGLIDPHVHLRDPGQTHKEDFLTGTSAALAGGYVVVMDMPNNAVPITTLERLEEKIASAREKVVSDIGFHFGTLGDNFDEFPKVLDKVMGLKIYLNVTTGGFIIDKDKLLDIYKAWHEVTDKPILLHAEEDVSDLVGSVLKIVPHPTHMCHLSTQKELEFVMRSKDKGLPVTGGATPHHLFLANEDADKLGPYGHMKPYLKSKVDQDFFWQHLDYLDVVESDHAPHTKAEKDSTTPPFGVPGLETTLPLMLTAEAEGRVTRQQLINLLHVNPAKIFNVPTDESTQIEVSLEEYEIKNEDLLTKAGWSPFAGRKVIQTVFENGRILAQPGSGRLLP